MVEALLKYLRSSLPPEIATLTEPHIAQLERGEYEALLQGPDAQVLFGHGDDSKTKGVNLEDFPSWNDYIFHRLGVLLADRRKPEKQSVFFCIGYAALLAFLQSNVTGPPIPFLSAQVLLPTNLAEDHQTAQSLRSELLESLGMDGIAAYKLTPNVELLCLADAVFTCPPILKHVKPARWAKLRVVFLQQRLLSEVSASLQQVIYEDIDLLQASFTEANLDPDLEREIAIEFGLERAAIHIHHGFDKLAREDLEMAKQKREFEFALTGRLGKRTKFQEKDFSQLVVLARSHSKSDDLSLDSKKVNGKAPEPVDNAKPTNIDLNDDTLLESISFSESRQDPLRMVDEAALPQSLSTLEPSSQPQLDPLDSTILLAFASSITNTSPQDGLTREETLPYATRVLDGGSSNWQVYTQALLVRSRIEGYKPRTVERGLLQLQALVDQVIADTTEVSAGGDDGQETDQSTTFLPRPKQSESAPVTQRLAYIFQLASPYRWDLEAELASRWVQLGGFRSALEIYERLEMWAESALCWAATDREDKAKLIIRRQLFHTTDGDSEGQVADDETWSGPPREPPPTDAPRLYCILGDMDQSPEMYEKAWELSNQRYARAQRSLGRYYFARKDFGKAAEAYRASLKANQLNETSWFALGCAFIELEQYTRAVEAFSRCVQLDETDAEAWSNLAAALLRKGTGNAEKDEPDAATKRDGDDDEPIAPRSAQSSQDQNRADALKALKRAAALKRDSFRIWENVLIAAASLSPPEYASILSAQKSIIHLRGSTEGEKCIDISILELLIQHIMAISDHYDPSQPGLQRMAVKFVDESVVPLITSSAELWRLVSKLAVWRNRPSSALDAEEKAWRVVTSQSGWETESEKHWDEVVEATVRLCDSYESLGQRERTEGMGAGELVAKDWKFKARTALRGIMGKGKGSWEGTQGWEKLRDALDGLKN